MSLVLQTRGFEEAVALLANVDIPGQLGEGVTGIVGPLIRFGAVLTPVDTGAMRGAWRDRVQGMTGSVYIDPAATNPRSGVSVTGYAGAVSDRLGILDAMMIEGERLGAVVLEGIEWQPR